MNGENKKQNNNSTNIISEKKSYRNKIILFIFIGVSVIGLGYITYKYFDNKQNKIAILEAYLKENYSNFIIDGSTSLIPLHEALEEKFGEGKEIKHSKTVAAFENFVDGKIDILLAVDYLDSYFDDAQAKNITINKKEITKEALVFLKNKEFELDSLTLDQIKQIYNKDITSWGKIDKSYSGDDERGILPIYRNEDSGSGMAMINLLGKNNVSCSDNDCMFINDMGGVINALAYGLGEMYGDEMIAYNMYTFTEKQYYNENVTTFKINGVAPNDDTIYAGEYPVILYNYIYYKNDKAKEFGEKLYEYLTSTAGQKLIMENGYVPLEKQDDAITKNNSRNCKDNFVDEVCVKNEGYNEEINKYVKINIDNKSEKYEYFDTVEEYIFANSDITREQFNNLSNLLSKLTANDTYSDNITFKKQSNGDILLNTGFCGGSACIWLAPNENYDFGESFANDEEDFSLYNEMFISKDFKTLYFKETEFQKGFSIPIKDFSSAFKIDEGF